uniref:Photoreceptor cadherin n=1 Tax=Sinocyclocheilus grahami TaxID=75366 RepID=A0A672KWM9_SINGR
MSFYKEFSPRLFISFLSFSGQSDFAPYFYDNGAGSSNGNLGLFSISEDTSVGTHVYTLNGSDPEGEPVTYGMTFDKGSKDYFSVEPKSGNVTLIQTLDREVQDEIVAFVTITDGRNKVVENVRVFITDANDEKPEFLNLPLVVDVPEDAASGSSIYRVQAVDRDLGSGGSVTYYLQSTPSTKFTIDGHSGALRIRSGESLDYEVSRTHFVTVVAKDGGGKYHGKYQVMTSTAIITINVLDTQDSPPVFVATPYFGFVYEVSVPVSNGPQNRFELSMYEHPPEGEILRGLKITVNDSDQGANAKFRLLLVGPSRVLRVVPQTVLNEAQVTIIVENSSAIDYEKYQFLTFKLLAVEINTPERFSATAEIVINLLDTNDNIPKFSSEFYIARIPENSPGGSNLVSVTVSSLTLCLTVKNELSLAAPGLMFLIHATSGIIYTQPWASLDAEVKSKYNFYVKAEDTEGKYSLAEVFVTVLDQNDHPPEFNQNYLEKTMIIGAPVKIEAVDEDAEEPNNLIEYSIMKADPDNIFDINTSTGEIKLKPYIKSMEIVQNITKQKDCRWSVVVQARDRGSPSFSTTAVVKIDITENGLKGPMAAFLMQSRDNPMKALGLAISIITVIVLVTVMISTIMYFRNTKSNRITPARHIIRRRPKEPRRWTFRPWFGRSDLSFGKFFTDDETRDSTNNSSPRAKPPAPSAPVLPPPPPSERLRSVPTVSGSLRSGQNKDGSGISSALVSELKMRIEQKINEANQGYYY